MKFSIGIVSLSLITGFHFSGTEKDLFILTHPKLREFYSNQELKFSQSIFKKKNIRPELCEKVKNAHVIVADRPIYIPKNSNGSSESSNYIESLFFLNEYRYTEIGKSRKSDGLKTKLYFNNKEIEEHVITCEYGELQKTSIYLTKIFRGEHFFLFGKTEKTDKLPKLLAVVGKYFELEPVNYGRRLSIVDMILKYNEKKTDFRNLRLVKKLFYEDNIEIFELCASLLAYELRSENKEKYILTIPGPDNNLKIEFPAHIISSDVSHPLPGLMCQIRKVTDIHSSLELKIYEYIIPNIMMANRTARIFVKYMIFLNNLEYSIALYHFELPIPWRAPNSHKRLRTDENL